MTNRVCIFLLCWVTPALTRAEPIRFTRDVRPILARNCFPCHGPDEDAREAELRLDQRHVAVESGAIDPEQLENSELIVRVLSSDPELSMPPANSSRSLTEDEKKTLVRWVKQGANYERHWAFVVPSKPEPPRVSGEWGRNAIDAFLWKAMEREGIAPSAEADRYTLVRRVFLDLIGTPPTPAQADAFFRDNSPLAYETLVDELLKSKHYGEHWARQWLDLARYADTNGYEKDRPRSIWPYRDWVVNALNDDVPFDRFSIEQLAGDMLPDATLQQRIATGFHRNTMLNEEGGIDPLEYRFYAMVDRVATTGTVWLGLTTGCAQCHSHKYDPISHRDYYRFMALLNNADEPDLVVPSVEPSSDRRIRQEIARLESELRRQFPPGDGEGSEAVRREQHFQTLLEAWCNAQEKYVVPWRVAKPVALRANLPKLERLDDDSIFASGDFTKRDEYFVQVDVKGLGPMTALRLEALPDDRLPEGGPGRAYYEGRKGDFFLSEISIQADGLPVKIDSASRSYGKIAVGSGNAEAENVYDNEGSTGWSTANREGERHVLVLNFAEPVTAAKLDLKLLFERHFVAGLGRFRFSVTSAEGEVRALDLDAKVEELLLRDRESWTEDQQQLVVSEFLKNTPKLKEARQPIEQLRKQLAAKVTTMVMQERASDHPRQTYLHHRGEWLSPRAEVAPGVPEIFEQLPDEEPANRLALAKWLVSERNPLVARVTVNRAWRALMGHGLVRSDGDFGTQADLPTHPELLDWLACEFMEQGWSLKKLHRLIVTSAAYRQRSQLTDELARRDPHNRLFARAPRVRVSAESVRDIMLAASGLLSPKIGGPSVYPPQPESVTAIAYGATKWNTSRGEDRYRRSLYTFSKRTAPFAAYATFDGPSGENCVAKRDRSNTPLQALTLLNDQMYLEMARALARKALDERAGSVEDQLTWVFRRLLTRPPRAVELESLMAYFASQLKRLESGELKASEIVGQEDATAAWASLALVTRVLMNLDETITKQ